MSARAASNPAAAPVMRRVVPWLALAAAASLVLLVLRSLPRDRDAEGGPGPASERSAASAHDETGLRGVATETARVDAAAARPEDGSAPQPVAAEGERDEILKGKSEAGAHVSVSVVRADCGAPLAACKVVVWALEDPDDFTVAEDEGDVYESDAGGSVDAAVPAGSWLLVSAGGRRPSLDGAMPRVPEDEPAMRTEKVAPLAPGEVRQLRFALAIGRDGTFHGRLVDAEEGTPIGGARIEPTRERRGIPAEFFRPVSSDAGGRFGVPCSTWRWGWRGPPVWRIDADGYGPGLFVPRLGSETPDDALTLELRRAASLSAELRGVQGRSLVLRASATSHQAALQRSAAGFVDGLEWRGELDPSGTCTLDGLPALTELRVTLEEGDEVVRAWTEKLVLEPGEARTIEWDLRAQGMILGRLADRRGAPVPDAEVWLASEVFSRDGAMGTAWFREYDEEHVVQRGRTDAQGAFSFSGVPPGTWWVGPAPRPAEGERDGEPASDAAPLARRVVLADGQRERVVELTVTRGLFLRGTVVLPDGAPAGGVFVNAFCEGPPLSGAYAESGVDGTFVLGPLLDGEHEVWAFGGLDDLAGSDRVRARAGREDLVLRLQAAGTIEGFVVDAATGERSEAQVWLHECDEERPSSTGGSTDASGRFAFDDLAPGTYDLIATRYDGLFGSVPRVDVGAGAVRDGLRIELGPGATLEVRCSGSSGVAWFEVFAGERRVHVDGIESGTSATCTVPPGDLRVMVAMGRTTQERTVALAAGERAEIAFEFP
jgi:hypothetical protein